MVDWWLIRVDLFSGSTTIASSAITGAPSKSTTPHMIGQLVTAIDGSSAYNELVVSTVHGVRHCWLFGCLVVWLFGCLVVGLFGCLVVWLLVVAAAASGSWW